MIAYSGHYTHTACPLKQLIAALTLSFFQIERTACIHVRCSCTTPQGGSWLLRTREAPGPSHSPLLQCCCGAQQQIMLIKTALKTRDRTVA
jgi:hypothetical protein